MHRELQLIENHSWWKSLRKGQLMGRWPPQTSEAPRCYVTLCRVYTPFHVIGCAVAELLHQAPAKMERYVRLPSGNILQEK